MNGFVLVAIGFILGSLAVLVTGAWVVVSTIEGLQESNEQLRIENATLKRNIRS